MSRFQPVGAIDRRHRRATWSDGESMNRFTVALQPEAEAELVELWKSISSVDSNGDAQEGRSPQPLPNAILRG